MAKLKIFILKRHLFFCSSFKSSVICWFFCHFKSWFLEPKNFQIMPKSKKSTSEVHSPGSVTENFNWKLSFSILIHWTFFFRRKKFRNFFYNNLSKNFFSPKKSKWFLIKKRKSLSIRPKENGHDWQSTTTERGKRDFFQLCSF